MKNIQPQESWGRGDRERERKREREVPFVYGIDIYKVCFSRTYTSIHNLFKQKFNFFLLYFFFNLYNIFKNIHKLEVRVRIYTKYQIPMIFRILIMLLVD